MSRSGDFCGDDDRQTDRQTDYFTSAHARGVMNDTRYMYIIHLYPYCVYMMVQGLA